jgi:hypothetical protein
VLGGIETEVFDFFGNLHADRVLDTEESGSRHCNGPHDDAEAPNNLHAKLLALLARVVGGSGVRRLLHVGVDAEDAGAKEAPEAAEAVHHTGITGIIDFQLLHEFGAEEEDDGADKADDDGVPRIDDGAVGCDADKAGHDAVESHGDIVGA